MTDETPKLFISYSWTSSDHEQWVINLATELRESGIDVILDKWDLKEGHDAHAFMEKMVTDSDIKKVAIICDKNYAEKADGRSGGVGTETQIISGEIYVKEDQNKFVAVLCNRDPNGNAYLPTYYKSRIYIDLSDQDLFSKNFEQLLRWVYDKPLYIKPDLGNKPAFLSDEPLESLGTSATFRRALDAIRNNKEYASGSLNEYFDTFIQNLEKLRIKEVDGEFDDMVVESIEQFLPYRNEVIEIFLAVAQYRNTTETHQQLHRFIEGIIPYLYKPKDVTSFRESDFDNFRFIVHELFLYLIASLLKYECFETVSYLLRHHYYIESNLDSNKMMSFANIRTPVRSLTHRNDRMNLRRISVRADLLEQRSKTSGLSFRQLMQADFILYVRDCFDSITEKKDQYWWPETLLYIERYDGAFEIFARASSEEYFNKIKCLIGISKKQKLEPLIEAYNQGTIKVPQWEWNTFEPVVLMNYEKLATKS
jgi:TIR domain-containing protein